MTPQASPPAASQPSKRHGWQWLAAAGAIALVIGIFIYVRLHAAYLGAMLVRSSSQQILSDARLLEAAQRQGPPLYAQHCASCHGAQREGNRQAGVPNLADKIWLYGDGSIDDIETTILYGIRSGHPRAHNSADMRAFGRMGQLTEQDIHDVVEYVLLLSKQPHQEESAKRGLAIFQDAGQCYDCHASDGEGVPDYGAPALTGRGGSWMYGGDRDTLYKSIYDGRHGLCPAWIGKLRFDEIRALSVYLHEASQ